MQAPGRSWFLLRVAVLAAAAFAVLVGVCVVAAAQSRAPAATSLVDFTGMWSDNENTGYDEEDDNHDSVVRDSVVGHAQRQLDILRGHLSRQAEPPAIGSVRACEYLILFFSLRRSRPLTRTEYLDLRVQLKHTIDTINQLISNERSLESQFDRVREEEGPEGPPGRPGFPGMRGTPGPSGANGEPGAEGLRGPRGRPGNNGARGFPGRRGPSGKDGADGRTGPRGFPGRPGPMGIPGRPGVPGKDGEPGLQGIPGAAGCTPTPASPVQTPALTLFLQHLELLVGWAVPGYGGQGVPTARQEAFCRLKPGLATKSFRFLLL